MATSVSAQPLVHLASTLSTLELKIILTDVLCEALFFGMQGVVAVVGIYILCFRFVDSQTSLRINYLVVIIVFLFCLSACSLSMTIWTYMATFDRLGGTFDSVDVINKAPSIVMVVQRLTYFISDLVVVWRAWLLWNRNTFVKLLLVVCLLGTITATFAQGTLTIKDIIRGSGPSTLILTLPPLITNFCATILVGFRIWEYRASTHELCGSSVNILFIFLESSALYSLFWVLAILETLRSVTSPLATSAILGSLPYVTSIYPMVVIVLVALEKNDYGSTIPSFHAAALPTSLVRETSHHPVQISGLCMTIAPELELKLAPGES